MDRGTDIHDITNRCFSKFANAPEKTLVKPVYCVRKYMNFILL